MTAGQAGAERIESLPVFYEESVPAALLTPAQTDELRNLDVVREGLSAVATSVASLAHTLAEPLEQLSAMMDVPGLPMFGGNVEPIDSLVYSIACLLNTPPDAENVLTVRPPSSLVGVVEASLLESHVALAVQDDWDEFDPDGSRLSVARHEAAHALVALVLGGYVVQATAADEHTGTGLVQWVPPATEELVDHYWSRLRVAVAGAVADGLQDYAGFEIGASSDFEAARINAVRLTQLRDTPPGFTEDPTVETLISFAMREVTVMLRNEAAALDSIATRLRYLSIIGQAAEDSHLRYFVSGFESTVPAVSVDRNGPPSSRLGGFAGISAPSCDVQTNSITVR